MKKSEVKKCRQNYLNKEQMVNWYLMKMGLKRNWRNRMHETEFKKPLVMRDDFFLISLIIAFIILVLLRISL